MTKGFKYVRIDMMKISTPDKPHRGITCNNNK